MNRRESTDGSLLNEYTRINKTNVSSQGVDWPPHGYILFKTADSCRKHQGDFADAASQRSPAQRHVGETWLSFGKFKLCGQSV